MNEDHSYTRLRTIYQKEAFDLFCEIFDLPEMARMRIYQGLLDLGNGIRPWNEAEYNKAGPVRRSIMRQAVFLGLAKRI